MKGSTKDLAAAVGVSERRVRTIMATGRLDGTFEKVNGRYVFDIELAKQRLIDTASYTNPSKVLDEDDRSIGEIRKEHEAIKAAISKIELEKKRGDLVSLAQINHATFDIARACRDQLMTIPDRCAAILAAEQDTFNCKKILLQEITTALDELTGRILTLKPSQAGD